MYSAWQSLYTDYIRLFEGKQAINGHFITIQGRREGSHEAGSRPGRPQRGGMKNRLEGRK